MPKLKSVEKKIYDVEGFEVKFKSNGKDLRSDLVIPKQYEADRMSRNSFSVNDFKDKVKKQFPGYDLDVFVNDGAKARGQTKLATVRDTYLDDND